MYDVNLKKMVKMQVLLFSPNDDEKLQRIAAI